VGGERWEAGSGRWEAGGGMWEAGGGSTARQGGSPSRYSGNHTHKTRCGRTDAPRACTLVGASCFRHISEPESRTKTPEERQGRVDCAQPCCRFALDALVRAGRSRAQASRKAQRTPASSVEPQHGCAQSTVFHRCLNALSQKSSQTRPRCVHARTRADLCLTRPSGEC